MSKLPKPQKPVKRQKNANGYSFPERLPEGEVLRDSAKKEWVLGPTIGKGGFGEIYSASEYKQIDPTFPYAVKIEPHENGPLFMEKNFYIKIANRIDVESWKQSKKIKVLGIPTYYGSGTHNYNNQKYRFMVIERYGKDLWSMFLNNQRKFPPATVYKCALQIIDALNYIHDKDYIHGDIKGANLLLGIKSGTENNVFLVDFGLACKYTTKEFKRDPKQAHNGTIEYTSCDWHQGVPTRRGDFEILGYNLLQWLCSTLPWEKDIKNKEKVYDKKKELMANPKDYMDEHFPNAPKVMYEFFDYISKVKYNDCPNYKYCKDLFTKELKRLKAPVSGNLEFSVNTKKHKLMQIVNNESDEDIPIKRRKTPVKKRIVRNTTKKQESVEVAVTKTPERIPGTPAFETPKNISVLSDEDIFLTPDEFNKSSGLKNTPTKKETPKKTNKLRKSVEFKVSWKDAPTVRAGLRENKAGVYIKKTVTKKKYT